MWYSLNGFLIYLNFIYLWVDYTGIYSTRVHTINIIQLPLSFFERWTIRRRHIDN